ncbi:MAG: tripartite tricarboxylate transporter TctB family protein [Planctomycetes bacterium]|nr:tripartite tricarboxylate transporter TctB family protein [Planctomycetota bacterium]
MQQDDQRLAGPDLITSVALMGLGTAIMIESARMRVFRTIIVSPGLFPFILGAVFVFFGVVIFFLAVRRGGLGQVRRILSIGYFREVWSSPRFRRGMIVFLLILAYVVLFGNPNLARLNFTIAAGSGVTAVNVGFIGVTACYLVATFLFLKAMRLPAALAASLFAATVIFFAFNKGFGVPIP